MSTAQKSLTLSTLAYRRLLSMYPRGFRDQFGEPMAQAFGDLARRAVSRGGAIGLVLLWMRMLPDLAVSALREYLHVASRLGPSNLTARWILACTLGAGLGVLAGGQLARVAPPHQATGSIGLALGLGLFQSVWALRRSTADAARWMAATAAGIFAFAMPFRMVVARLPLGSLSLSGEFGALVIAEIVAWLLAGAGIGLLQSLATPGPAVRAWRWVALNAFAFLSARYVVLALSDAAGVSPLVQLAAPFLGGLTFGSLTAVALGSVTSPGVQTAEAPSAAS